MILLHVVIVHLVIVVAHDYNTIAEENLRHVPGERHIGFDIVVGVFITFIICMIVLHCYLKRKEKKKVELSMDL